MAQLYFRQNIRPRRPSAGVECVAEIRETGNRSEASLKDESSLSFQALLPTLKRAAEAAHSNLRSAGVPESLDSKNAPAAHASGGWARIDKKRHLP